MLNQIRNTHAHRSAGYSLIELVVASAVLLVVMVYVMGTFQVQNQTHIVVDQLSETQQNTQAIAALIERDLRSAGFMVPTAAAACAHDSTIQPDVLFVSDTDAIQPADQLPTTLSGASLSAEILAFTAGAGTTFTATLDMVTIDENDSYDVDGNGTLDADFQVDGGLIVVDTANPGRGMACGLVTAINLGTNQVVVDLGATSLAVATPNPQQLVAIPAHVYRIVVPAGEPTQLLRDDLVLARDVEDLQVAMLFDDDADCQLDAGEYRGAAGNVFDSSAVDGNDLREIRLNFVARTRTDDPANPNAAGTGQARENRDTNIPGDDGRRRRVHTATVRVRNVPIPSTCI